MSEFILKEGVYYKKTVEQISYDDDLHDLMRDVEEKSFWFKHRNEVIFTIGKDYLEGSKIYDVGGGNGFVTRYLQQKKIEVTLVEPGEKGAINARSRGVEKVYCCTVEEMDFENNTVDGFVFFDVLEHIEEDEKFLRLLNDKLRPGGFVLLTVPAKQYLWSYEDDVAGHFRRYDRESIRVTLQKSGYEDIQSHYFFEYLVLPILFLRKLRFFKKNTNMKEVTEKKAVGQHQANFFVQKILNLLHQIEIKRLKRGRSLLMGSSLIVLAKKRGEHI